MEAKIREIVANDYTEVVFLWNHVLGVRTVTDENFRVTMEQMIKAGNYKTFVALLENHVVGFTSIVHSLAVGSANGYLHITGLAVHNDYQRHRVGTELLRYTENYAKDSGISSIILCTGMKRTDAHAFYEHNGYDKDSYCFDKIIKID
ncbi:GNAT family N-acetyltransferase [Paenibacillus sp. OV219]|uniref:GNAT family N-acetyltransferase n=1 Tax=Paenibacillus sp. OV219 TaxID=1884377 RepID=UPI0008D41052|nr:GNAT family N-acetyltransferase [Paenibacillus sp. OV219]SEO04142.1 Ribosomal protein S18 acetylase RimI [Paenibacillus sp. OV219]